jgi:hypothetical protein
MIFGNKRDDKRPHGNSITRQLVNDAETGQEMGKMLPVLQDIYFFVRHLKSVATNIFRQLACLYFEKLNMYKTTFHSVELNSVWTVFGSLLEIMITIDSLIKSNKSVEDGMTAFKKLLIYFFRFLLY